MVFNKLLAALLSGLVISLLVCSAMLAETAPSTDSQASSGGPYGASGFSGSGYTGNGFYPSASRAQSYEVYNPSVGSAIIQSVNDKDRSHWGWLGLLGLLGWVGAVQVRRR